MARKHCNNVTPLLAFFCILFSAGIFLANIAKASVIKFPDTYPNIQAAINAASAKDVIWVAEGIYNENIVLKADVKLEGGWKSDFSVRNWDDWPSIIDGGGRGSVVIGANKATLDGFSITNGDAEWGGGIYSDVAAMTIKNNTIHNNLATHGGGGIYIARITSPPPYTDIWNNTIRNNQVTNGAGGIYVRFCNNIRIIENVIGGGLGKGNSAYTSGGGIYIEFTDVFWIEDNNISNNYTTDFYGGGLFITGGSPNATVSGNTIEYNSAKSGGGGIFSQGSTYIDSNNIRAILSFIYLPNKDFTLIHDEPMFLGFGDVATKSFKSVISHVHWVYCAYILLNFHPPGITKPINSITEKQRIIGQVAKRKEVSHILQLITQINGVERLKSELREALACPWDCQILI